MPPAVTMQPSAAMTSVAAPMVMPGVMPLCTSGLPAWPMAAMRPCLIPMSALMTPLHGVEDQRVGQHEVERFGVEREGGLAHAVADDLAAAEFHLVAVAAALRDEIALDLDEKFRVGQPHAVARRSVRTFRRTAAVTGAKP